MGLESSLTSCYCSSEFSTLSNKLYVEQFVGLLQKTCELCGYGAFAENGDCYTDVW